MIIVVGGGPAGMSAALAAANANAEVIMVDAASRLGGQYWRHASPKQLDASGAALVAAVSRHPNIEVISNAKIWRADTHEGETTLHVLVFGKTRELKTTQLILATGAFDRTLPFPGWDIPGVMTPGAAQALLKGSGVVAGKKIVLAGTGPFLLPVSVGLANAGAHIAGLFEANRRRRWFKHLVVLGRNLSKVFLALSYQRELRKFGVKVREGLVVVQANPNSDGVLESVKVARINEDFRVIPQTDFLVPCDVLAVGWGFTADLSLAGNLGLQCAVDEDGAISVVVDENQATSVKGIWAAGEICGIGGAELAQTEGTIAGLAAAGIVGTYEKLRNVRRRQTQFAKAINDVYSIGPHWRDWLRESTLICRCEEVSLGEIDSAITKHGATDARSAKLLTRAGMGLCQGRICSRSFQELVNAKTDGASSGESSIKFGYRPIVTPITFEELTDSFADPDLADD